MKRGNNTSDLLLLRKGWSSTTEFRDLASIIYHNVFLLFSISIILTFFIHLFYSLLQLPLQNRAHNVPVFFISRHEC